LPGYFRVSVPKLFPIIPELCPKGTAYQTRKGNPQETKTSIETPTEAIKLDLPVDLKTRLKILAKKEGAPVSQLVTFLLDVLIHQLVTSTISLGLLGTLGLQEIRVEYQSQAIWGRGSAKR
jgi:hypothetical protein